MLYVYAITASERVPLIPGVQGAALSATGSGGIFAVWSEHDDPRLGTDETALWEHERVAEALLDEGPVLPMRFGSWAPDREAVAELLAERHAEFERGLEQVRGAVEIGVRTLVQANSSEHVPIASGEARPGTSYMLARLNEEKKSAAIAAYVHEPLVALSRASRGRRSSLTGSVNTAYLVALEDVELFRVAVEKLDDLVEGATVICTGPWPPYSFTPEGSRG